MQKTVDVSDIHQLCEQGPSTLGFRHQVRLGQPSNSDAVHHVFLPSLAGHLLPVITLTSWGNLTLL